MLLRTVKVMIANVIAVLFGVCVHEWNDVYTHVNQNSKYVLLFKIFSSVEQLVAIQKTKMYKTTGR